MRRILAVADDLTGAAEIAGIGHRFGLEARVVVDPRLEQRSVFARASERGELAEVAGLPVEARLGLLSVLDTDSRLLPAPQAGARVAAALRGVSAPAPDLELDLVFKKVDSALRGPVLAEVEAALDALGLARALVVPSNPSRGRTIVGGTYRIAGVPLDRTEFARDPHSPARSADVLEILGHSETREVRSLVPGAEVPPAGISVGDAADGDDIAAWAARVGAARVDRGTLPAGAADFFEAILRRLGLVEGGTARKTAQNGACEGSCLRGRSDRPPRDGPALLVSGSVSAASAETLERAGSLGIPVVAMPPEILTRTSSWGAAVEAWAAAVASALSRALSCGGRAVIASGRRMEDAEGRGDPRPAAALAEVTARVLAHEPVEELLLEGGATASAIVRRLGWTELAVTAEVAPGIVRMAVPAANPRSIVLKPGSYRWPEGLIFPSTSPKP